MFFSEFYVQTISGYAIKLAWIVADNPLEARRKLAKSFPLLDCIIQLHRTPMKQDEAAFADMDYSRVY
jgi:hypothetical protein